MIPAKTILKNLFDSIELLHRRRHRQNPVPAHVTHAQIRVMDCLFRHPDHAMMLKDIANELGLTPAAVSQTVEILVRRDRVIREVMPGNRRAVNIRLSPAGLAIKTRADEFYETAVNDALKEIPQDELEAFAKVLQTLRNRLQEEIL